MSYAFIFDDSDLKQDDCDDRKNMRNGSLLRRVLKEIRHSDPMFFTKDITYFSQRLLHIIELTACIVCEIVGSLYQSYYSQINVNCDTLFGSEDSEFSRK
ncbi:hypothetical protein CEXT_431531 [Caerostris extrusa]|uniref:Uncharacterized protein n=1 Tax=Caerostris extrusa TaxID=172846 RepID=A0AAV4QP04_CAEEX|nr:hypothetical protein CEXT_431531 [Caerostris extrusa]